MMDEAGFGRNGISPRLRGDERGVTERTVRGHAVMLHYVDAIASREIVGDERLSSYSNYFLSQDRTKWKSRVANYEKVVVKEVWPGIDMEYRPQMQGVETVFRVKPGAEASRIVLEYKGLDAPLRVDNNGNLILTTSVGELHEQAPFAYQIKDRRQQAIPVRFRLLGENRYGLVYEDYDRTTELVIDPLVYSTFIAGSIQDRFLDMTEDSSSNKLVCGDTWRSSFVWLLFGWTH